MFPYVVSFSWSEWRFISHVNFRSTTEASTLAFRPGLRPKVSTKTEGVHVQASDPSFQALTQQLTLV